MGGLGWRWWWNCTSFPITNSSSEGRCPTERVRGDLVRAQAPLLRISSSSGSQCSTFGSVSIQVWISVQNKLALGSIRCDASIRQQQGCVEQVDLGRGKENKVSVMGARGWNSARLGFAVCGYLAFFCGGIVPQAEAGCRQRESPNCCTGRNNECFEYTRRKTVCYCDTYCQKTGDCCEDYQSVCQISGELFVLIF